MILGVDHISLSCDDIHRISKEFEQAGFAVKFKAEAVPNHACKTGFLRNYNRLHSLAFCQAETGIAIELTNHGSALQTGGRGYEVLFSNPFLPAGSTLSDNGNLENALRQTLCENPQTASQALLQGQFWFDAASSPAESNCIRGIILPVANLEKAQMFWQKGLGCRLVAKDEGQGQWLHLAFVTPVPNWSLDIILVQDSRRSDKPCLDDAGFTCLALLSTNLQADVERAQRAGALAISEQFTLEINGKKLEIALVRGPNNELVELMQILPENTPARQSHKKHGPRIDPARSLAATNI